MKQDRLSQLILLSLLISPATLMAYEIETHADISRAAAEASVLRDASKNGVLWSLGLRVPFNDQTHLQDFTNSEGKSRNIEDLIGDGARFEDGFLCSDTRPRNHFFDPTSGGGLHWTAALKFELGTINVTGIPSPDWALEDTGKQRNQDFSWINARDYLYRALTATDKDLRNQNLGLAFQTLGHLTHHIADMAQPQHVRNDPHYASPPDCGPATFLGKIIKENFSRYEHYTDSVRSNLSFDGYKPVNQKTDSNFLTTARQFWSDSGRGIADFTNANFVSAGTNFDKQPGDLGYYPSPSLNPSTVEVTDIQTLCAEAAQSALPCDSQTLALSGEVIFYGNVVQDDLRPAQSGFNARETSESIFDQDLKAVGDKPVFTLNRFNFDSALGFLIPRAVAYSAGLIDYFFRGRLGAEDVELTETGMRLRVINAIDAQSTPAWKNETLYATNAEGAPGQFVLAYEYQDADGTKHYGASQPVAAKTAAEGGGDLAPGSTSTAIYDFAFTLPADAHEVKYRLIYRGKLGQEDDAVAVGQVEPTSGFLVSPSYTPADGIAGPRMIVRNGGVWRLTDKTGLRAGNVDWKGWYVNGHPTKILSWSGSAKRYFPTRGFVEFSTAIYQNGELWSVAPRPVLGAAIAKDADGTEWIVAITSDSTNDIVYRRHNTNNTSPAMFDPIAAPEGWQQLAFFAPLPGLLPPDRGWFFNGTGTEAQTIRRQQSTDGRSHLTRLKVTVDATSAQIVDMGNSPGFVTTRTTSSKASDSPLDGPCRPSGTETVEATTTVALSGEYVIAVDYLDRTEILVKLMQTGGATDVDNITTNWTMIGCSSPRNIVRSNSQHEVSSSIDTSITIDLGQTAIPQLASQGSLKANYLADGLTQISGTSTTAMRGILLVLSYLDARNGFYAGVRTPSDTELDQTLDKSQFCQQLSRNDVRNLDVIHYGRNDIVGEEHDSAPGGGFCSSRGSLVGPLHTALASTLIAPVDPVPAFISLETRAGTWAVDSNGNVAVSEQLSLSGRWFNHLSEGDLGAVIPNAPSDARYGVAVIR